RARPTPVRSSSLLGVVQSCASTRGEGRAWHSRAPTIPTTDYTDNTDKETCDKPELVLSKSLCIQDLFLICVIRVIRGCSVFHPADYSPVLDVRHKSVARLDLIRAAHHGAVHFLASKTIAPRQHVQGAQRLQTGGLS